MAANKKTNAETSGCEETEDEPEPSPDDTSARLAHSLGTNRERTGQDDTRARLAHSRGTKQKRTAQPRLGFPWWGSGLGGRTRRVHEVFQGDARR